MKSGYPLPLLVLAIAFFATGCSSSRKAYALRNRLYKVEYIGQYDVEYASSKTARIPDSVRRQMAAERAAGIGHAGPPLRVRVRGIREGDSVLLAIDIVSDEKTGVGHYIVNPRLGTLGIFSTGGRGKRGDASMGELGGDGGVGGTIEVRFDSSALAYVDCSCLQFYNPGGEPWDAGKPVRSGPHAEAINAVGNYGAWGLYGDWGPAIRFEDAAGRLVRTNAPIVSVAASYVTKVNMRQQVAQLFHDAPSFQK